MAMNCVTGDFHSSDTFQRGDLKDKELGFKKEVDQRRTSKIDLFNWFSIKWEKRGLLL
ncbi:hypothetical protein J8TS2_11420 [Lederbergia ruris]|uniref:Uncharacterized protein n=1 Tax=Lederbergia ruris TaxID=217495 RepID=A0ABQ4KFS2_9BACI|nr:hypothetical protein J8TS2_11420 [Lederbergia ruris]